jgi:PAS domain S-box-containing protein
MYASGVLTSRERAEFEVVLEFHSEARAWVRELEAISAYSCAPALADRVAPPESLKSRVLAAINGLPQELRDHGFVMCGADGLVQWVNPAFSQMCGYSLEELAGRKLGPLLQGAETDQEAVARIRTAVHAKQSVTENLVNYHKSGRPYWVTISITPILDVSGDVKWFVAREREMRERPLAA